MLQKPASTGESLLTLVKICISFYLQKKCLLWKETAAHIEMGGGKTLAFQH